MKISNDIEVDVCLSCVMGHHDECDDFWTNFEEVEFEWLVCCCGGEFNRYEYALSQKQLKGLLSVDGSYLGDPNSEDEIETYIDEYQGTKNPDEYVDPVSSGRKMAAKVAPIVAGQICEWAWLAKAGGGPVPIMGCPGRPASDRHHGPDKNTLNNQLGINLHRICDWCHNQWHAKNDPFYGERPTRPDGSVDGSIPFVPIDAENQPHDPFTKAKDEEVYAEDALRREEARKHGANL